MDGSGEVTTTAQTKLSLGERERKGEKEKREARSSLR